MFRKAGKPPGTRADELGGNSEGKNKRKAEVEKGRMNKEKYKKRKKEDRKEEDFGKSRNCIEKYFVKVQKEDVNPSRKEGYCVEDEKEVGEKRKDDQKRSLELRKGSEGGEEGGES